MREELKHVKIKEDKYVQVIKKEKTVKLLCLNIFKRELTQSSPLEYEDCPEQPQEQRIGFQITADPGQYKTSEYDRYDDSE